ncbi:hypothetical protein [Thiolinea disciformis]|uniref:hypothetical protein n=1 Tax=Thiolinea disciformis TaxID=125614 RepID=UPI00038122A3|nr:hypothetical protein [Thiolinea disciformis]
MNPRFAPLAVLIVTLTTGFNSFPSYADNLSNVQVPASASDLVRIFTPRDEEDEELDTEELSETETVSVYPKVAKDPSNDAFNDMLNLMAADPHYLSEGDVRRMVQYFEWALEVPLINSERNELREQIIAEHDKDGGQSSRAYQFLSRGVGTKIGNVYFDALSNPFDEWQRRDLQREYLPLLRREAKNGDGLAQWLMGRYDEVQPPLTAGKDALRPQVAKVYVEHVVFALNEIAGAKPEKPIYKVTPELQIKIAQQLIAAWSSLDKAKRQELLDLPFVWANTVKAWPTKNEAEKTQARIVWGKQFTPLFTELAPIHKARVDAYEKAEAEAKAKQLEREKTEAKRVANLTPEQKAAEYLANQQLMHAMISNQMQANMQMQQQNMQALSNMQQSWHNTNMNIINNMNSTWTYEYVYK